MDNKEQHKIDRSKKVRAYITKGFDGQTRVIPETELEKYRVARNKETNLSSQQLMQSDYIMDYTGENLIKAPYNLSYLWRFMELCTEHSACVRQKASDVCGLGWKIVKRKGIKDANIEEKNKLEAFFDFGNPDETFTEIIEKVWIDYESMANAYLEVIRNPNTGEPAALYHIPAQTIKCGKMKDIFIQIRGFNKKIFRRFNTGDRVTKAWAKTKIYGELLKAKSNKKLSDPNFLLGWDFEKATSELIQIKNYSSRSSYYGIPEWIASLGAILGNVQCRDYNLKFFDNNGVPHYAIIIKGADLDPDMEKVIATYFSQEIRGDAHKTLIIPINSQEVEVTFEKLSTDIKDASFRMYRQDNRDEIIRAHRVPFSRVNVAIPGKLGGGGVSREESETYKKSIIAPKQLVLEHRINEKIIKRGFGINSWILKFNKLDATDVETDMRIDTAYVKSGIKSINEARENCGLEPVEGGDRVFINTATGMVFLDEMESMLSGQAIGTQAQQEQNQVTEKALQGLHVTLQKLLDDREEYKKSTQGLVGKLINKILNK